MFLAVYDEYWRVMQRIAPLLTPVLGGYMALGALLYLLWARRTEPTPQAAA